jgi:hypothetical protein
VADVELTPDESQFVQDLINNFAVENQNSNLRWQIPHVTQHDAIPLYCGWFETIGLTATGEIVMWNAEGEYDDIRKPDDPQIVMCSRMEGLQRYPQLKSLRPVRPATAVTCGPCKGTGKISLPNGSELFCNCSGVGWLDP